MIISLWHYKSVVKKDLNILDIFNKSDKDNTNRELKNRIEFSLLYKKIMCMMTLIIIYLVIEYGYNYYYLLLLS